jgi:hypothetical protein
VDVRRCLCSSSAVAAAALARRRRCPLPAAAGPRPLPPRARPAPPAPAPAAQERNSRGCGKDHRLLERSVFSDRMVFVRAVVDAQWMTPMELAIYDSWFAPLVEQLGCLVGQHHGAAAA